MLIFFQNLTKKQKTYLTLLIFGMLITSFLEVLGISIIIPIVYSLTDNTILEKYYQFEIFKNFFSFNDKFSTLIFFLSFFCIVFLIKNIYLIIFHYFEAKFIFNLVRDISSKLYKNYINQNYNLIIKESSSKFITKLSNEINQLQAFIISILILLSESLILFLIVLFLLYLYSFKIIFLLVAFFILIYIFFLLAYKKINKLGAGRKSLEILRIKNIQETSGGIKDIKILGFEKSFAQKYFSYANLISKFYYKYFTIQKF